MAIEIYTTATSAIDSFEGNIISIDDDYYPQVQQCETVEQSVAVIQAGIDQGHIRIVS
jgi:hypothetical protein